MKIAVLSCTLCFLTAATLVGCASQSSDSPALTQQAVVAAPRAQIFSGMGTHTRTVTTHSSQAQRYFNQGLTWTYAFNHDEAIRSFEEAAELDPSCAMAWWGVALCHGPHINYPMMPEERSKAAWSALQKALELRANASPVEQAMIQALAARYASPAPADRSTLDREYAGAMKLVYQRYPDDLDVATLYAESLMDLQPWDLWTHDGEPKGRTVEIVSVLEGVLSKNPRHPGAAHLYIHAVEASSEPERAIESANILRKLVPMSGHLTHMPSHIDARVGAWSQAAEANRRAIATDAKYRALSPRQGFYTIYMLHNEQFLSFACMMLGRSEESIAAARRSTTMLPAEWVRENASTIDGYLTIHMDALKRFGKWNEILTLEEPPSYLPYTTAMWRCNRAIAFAAKGEIDAAQHERELFREACNKVPAQALAQINPASRVLALAGRVIDGEIAYAKRDYATAESELRAAASIEDTLQYMEPPDWMVPVRHTLGAVLLSAGKPQAAEHVYREDLHNWPSNGWALTGLVQALELQGKSSEARKIRTDEKRAWSEADTSPHASCLCAPKAQ